MVWDALVEDTSLLEKADVVIADLPCSGIGVIGRKPDIKYKLKAEQIEELAALQREILSVVIKYLKPGGVLIYSTCTIDRRENQDNRNWLLDNFGLEADSLNSYLPEELICDTTEKGYLQLLPGVHKTDGFFVSRFILRK